MTWQLKKSSAALFEFVPVSVRALALFAAT